MVARQSRGFTLVEILAVLAIVALITGITMGGFTSLRNSNRRTTCQTNLTQIYQACRLYAQDYTAMPYYNPGPANSGQPTGGLGLWALYTYPDPTNSSLPAPLLNTGGFDTPVECYLRNLNALHCPNDNFDWDGDGISSNQPYSLDNGVSRVLNPDYLSYQSNRDGSSTVSTYSLYRDSGNKRQLQYWDSDAKHLGAARPSDSTIITWCRFHRHLDSSGATQGTNNYDNVLFYDGSVQWLPQVQTVTNIAGDVTNTCENWQRVPRQMVNSSADPTACKPTATD